MLSWIQLMAVLTSCMFMVARKVATNWYSNNAPAVFPNLNNNAMITTTTYTSSMLYLDSQTTLVVMVSSHCRIS